MEPKNQIVLPLFMLVGGPKNVPLMLEQGGLRYATLFTSEASVSRFRQASCQMDSYQPQTLTTLPEVEKELQTTRKFGCSLLLVDPLGPEIEREQAQLLAVFLRKLEDRSTAKGRGKK